MSYNLKVTYRAGPLNAVADFLSRYPVQPTAPVIIQDGEVMSTGDIERVSADMMKFHGMAMCATVKDDSDKRTLDFNVCTECPHKKTIVEQQANCTDCVRIRDCLAHKGELEFQSPLLQYARTCTEVCGVLVRPRRTEPHSYVPVVPKGLRDALIQAMHAGPGAGHLRWPKLFWLIADRYDWPGMQADIKKHLAACQVCLVDYPGHLQKADCVPFVTLSRFHRWSMDIVDLGHSPSDFRLAVVFVEYFTKFPVVVPIAAYTGKNILTALMNYVVAYFGVPAEVVADAHSTHSSKDFADPCKQMGISLNLSRGYSHTHAGQAERYIRTVLAMLRRSAEDSRDWVETLPLVLLHYRAAVHPGTGYSPAFLMYGEDIRLPCEKLLDFRTTRYTVDIDSAVQAMADCLAAANKVVLETNEEYRAQMVKDYRREHHQSPSSIAVGDQVYVPRKEAMNRHGRVKLDFRRYRGPYNVIDAKVEFPILTIRDPVSGATETINKRSVTKCERRLNVPHLPARRRNPLARIAAQLLPADSTLHSHLHNRDSKICVQNLRVCSCTQWTKMSKEDDLMLFDDSLDDVPTTKSTLAEKEAALDEAPPTPKSAEKVGRSTSPARVDFMRMATVMVDGRGRTTTPYGQGNSKTGNDRSGFRNDAREKLNRGRTRESASRQRYRKRGFRGTDGYESGEHATPVRRRSTSTASSTDRTRTKSDERALRRMIDLKIQSYINDGGSVLSGKMMFIRELITTPVHAYATTVVTTKGKGILPIRADAPLESNLLLAFVRAGGKKYSNMYVKYIEDFSSFTPAKYKMLRWNGEDLKQFSRAERENIRQFRGAIFNVFEKRCGVAAWTSSHDQSRDARILELRRSIEDSILVLQDLLKKDPLVAVMGSGFHLNDAYFRTLQRPQRQPSPFQFGKCFFTDCTTDALHITAGCPALGEFLSRVQPIKSKDGVAQSWDTEAYTAIVDAYIRCALAGLLPTSP
jgi:hypothetical protein